MGHDAWSCDLLPAEDESPHHIQGDLLGVIDGGWDLAVFHPPCTHLAVSGARWFKDKQAEQAEALEFVRALLAAPIPKIALENPVSIISSRIRKPDQVIQPWHYGADASKKTCLWLKGLPKLEVHLPNIVPPKGWRLVREVTDMLECEGCGEPYCPEHEEHYADCECISSTTPDATYKVVDGVAFATLEDPAPRMLWANQTPSGQNKLGPSADRWKLRSATYPGIAKAMAEQWG